LGSENDRWAASVVKISEDLGLLTGDVLMASSFISYAGPFNK
jgi:dynein heavy chain